MVRTALQGGSRGFRVLALRCSPAEYTDEAYIRASDGTTCHIGHSPAECRLEEVPTTVASALLNFWGEEEPWYEKLRREFPQMWQPEKWEADAKSRGYDPESGELYVSQQELEARLPWLVLPGLLPKWGDWAAIHG